MKITDKIHLLKIDFNVAIAPGKSLPRFVYSLIIFGDTITVIDSGVKDSCRAIYDYIEKNNRGIGEIKTLIISHAHPDHIGSAKKIKEDTGCKVIGHALEKNWIEDVDLQYKNRPVPGFYNLLNEGVVLDEIVHGGENIALDKDVNISIINTPGHSPGSFCILFREDAVLFTADVIPLENDIPTYDNYSELKKSLKLVKSLQGYDTMLSSWLEPVSGREQILQLISRGEKYMDKLDNAVRKYYSQREENPMDNCRKVIESLGLPPVFVNPLVERAFRTH
jgi:glyoxylase-like metal-dependent hydrolase (beta-lactamase superfamily II)